MNGFVDGLEGGQGGGDAACGVVVAEFEAVGAGEEGGEGGGGVEDCYFEHFVWEISEKFFFRGLGGGGGDFVRVLLGSSWMCMCKDGGVKGRRVASCFWTSPHRVAYCGACLGVVALASVLHFASFEHLFLVLTYSIELN